MAYFAERQAAASARMDGEILSRMSKVRETLRERAASLEIPLSEMLVCVGPCDGRGFYVGAISFEMARTIPAIARFDLQSPPAGQVLVFTWSHSGFANLRTLPLGE